MQAHQTSPFTPPQQALLLSLARGTTPPAACHAAQVSRRTLQHWIEQDEAFAEAVEAAEAAAIAVAEDLAFACAMKAAEDPRYLRALFFWLKHRAGWVQARPEPTPAPSPTPSVGGRRAVPASPSSPESNPPATDTGDLSMSQGPERLTFLDGDPSPSGDSASHTEKPGGGVPSVPWDAGASAHETNGRGTPAAGSPPPLAPASAGTAEKPGRRVPSVPSRQQDQLRMQQFRRKHRK